MKDEEVNKIIANYMGLEFEYCLDKECMFIQCKGEAPFVAYTQSLDELVPVWEKLEQGCIPELILVPRYPKEGENKQVTTEWRAQFKMKYGFGCTIQKAAAHATAKAILELNKNE